MSALQSYRSVARAAAVEHEVRRSRFIGEARPVSSEQQALDVIEAVRAAERGASHHCYAYVVGDHNEVMRQSDDGEPSGTAGKPILDVLRVRLLRYVVVVVTRYFGGVMLGAGGLVRAYGEAATLAIDAARPIVQAMHREVRVTIDYTLYGKVEYELREAGILCDPPEFTDRVQLICWPLASEETEFAELMASWTSGQAELVRGDVSYRQHELRQ